jgi:stearoyl-CoA desaturase (delta-9 desaturase)
LEFESSSEYFVLSQHIIALPNGRKINWPSAVVFGLFHVGAVAALFMFSWKVFFVALALHWFAVGWGISLGYHRLHTHQSYQCPKWFERLLGLAGAMSFEGGPIFWVGTHRIHHAKSDKPGDPHSPRLGGLFHAHLGWILFGETHHNDTEYMSKYAPDLARDPFYRWLNTWHWVPTAVLAVILFAWGGLPMFLWGICLRITYGLHVTWFINSLTHVIGSTRFDSDDDSKNSFVLAQLTFGEGWHNNHHAHPTSARHGMAWWELDISWLTLKLMRAVGLVWGVRTAKIDWALINKRAA